MKFRHKKTGNPYVVKCWDALCSIDGCLDGTRFVVYESEEEKQTYVTPYDRFMLKFALQPSGEDFDGLGEKK